MHVYFCLGWEGEKWGWKTNYKTGIRKTNITIHRLYKDWNFPLNWLTTGIRKTNINNLAKKINLFASKTWKNVLTCLKSSLVKPLSWIIFICFTIVLFPDSPAPKIMYYYFTVIYVLFLYYNVLLFSIDVHV